MNEKSDSMSNPGWFPKGRSGNLNGRPRAFRASKTSFECWWKRPLPWPMATIRAR
jgi:hypothetical protein